MSHIFRSRRCAHGPSRRIHRARLWLWPLEDRLAPANLIVTAPGDNGGPNQLRAMWETARTNGQADTITFAANVTIVSLTSALTAYGENAPVTITGNGKTVTTIFAPPSNRAFDFNVLYATPSIKITDLKLQGGNVTTGYGGAIRDDDEPLVLTNVAFTSNTAQAGGGALAVTVGTTLTINGCDFTNNTATKSSYSVFTGGGAIYLGGANTIALNTSTFSGNRALNGSSLLVSGGVTFSCDSTTFANGVSTDSTHVTGGALVFASGAAAFTMDHSQVTGNVGGTSGGGISFQYYYPYVNLTIQNTIISSNSAREGGGIWAASSVSITLSNDTVSNNTAVGAEGGGLKAFGDVTIANSKFTGNSAFNNGGAVYSSSSVTINNSTFASNFANSGGGVMDVFGNATISNSVFSGNNAAASGSAAFFSDANSIISSSLFTNNTGPQTYSGGAVGYGGATGTINSSQFSFNTAGYRGGALALVSNSSVTLNSCSFRGNTAQGSGGAISTAESATLNVNQCTFTGNTAGSTFGGQGGAIAHGSTAALTINNSTIADNTAIGNGGTDGGIELSGSGSLTLVSTIVAKNVIAGAANTGVDLHAT
ncbi:MAG: beta strand repeat-containing protein [Gemmataceae bacterium]